ncbi:MAG: IS256 family transposase [Candidatus Krumholzibacteria bacterium]|nr:IS256 family transposase [Candidatus Krumholzibacteria bacterium]
MSKRTPSPSPTSTVTWESLEEFARLKIQMWFQELLEQEVTDLLGREHHERRRAVDGMEGYRNGYGKPRRLSMQGGTITVRRPRVRALEERFESQLLPFFARRTKAVGELLPELYLHGLSQGDFELALRGLLGEGAPLSPSSIARLRGKWQHEYEAWRTRRLDDRELVYAWADGVYVKAGLEREKAALLVVIGAMSDGHKEVLAVEAGYRESTASWAAVLRDLRDRGLGAPKLFVADGNLGAWAALAQVWPQTREQRCWNHRIINVLDQLPKKLQPGARELLCKIPYAPTRVEAERRRDAFARRYRRSYPKAVAILEKDWERMVAFYVFPEAHWRHLRTTNVVESPFASVRLRTTAAKRYKKVESATALIWKVLCVAERRFRTLNAPELLPGVYADAVFTDGRFVTEEVRREVA